MPETIKMSPAMPTTAFAAWAKRHGVQVSCGGANIFSDESPFLVRHATIAGVELPISLDDDGDDINGVALLALQKNGVNVLRRELTPAAFEELREIVC